MGWKIFTCYTILSKLSGIALILKFGAIYVSGYVALNFISCLLLYGYAFRRYVMHPLPARWFSWVFCLICAWYGFQTIMLFAAVNVLALTMISLPIVLLNFFFFALGVYRYSDTQSQDAAPVLRTR